MAATASYGVLVSPTTAAMYTVSLVGVDGKVAASAQATSPPAVTCGNTAEGLVSLPVSASNSKLYFMDASGAIRTLTPGGAVSSGPLLRVAIPTPSRRSMFAVSPDDSRVAIVTVDFTATGATTNLFMYQLSVGPPQNPIFNESGSYTLWPIGWHAGNLVVAKVPACTQGGGPTCCGPLELHVVDPATAARRDTLGGPNCVIAGAPSPAGAVCDNPTFTTASGLDWTGTVRQTIPISGPEGAYLSPSGNEVALVDNSGTGFAHASVKLPGLLACGWIDETHVLAGGDAQSQPRVGELPSGVQVPVAAQGDCAGRIPGGL